MKRFTSLFASLGLLVLAGAGCAAPVDTPTEPEPQVTKTPMEQPSTQPTGTDLSLADFTSVPTTFPGIIAEADRMNRSVVVHTDQGDITLALYGDEAPAAVSNFLVLASTGYYDGVRFHRIIEDFMIQTGDPQSKDLDLKGRWGTGGPGYAFADELGHAHSTYAPGTLAMANSGPNTNGSQFFIMHGNTGLPNLYTIFGEVTDGLDIVNALAVVEVNGDSPVTAPVIESIEVLPAK